MMEAKINPFEERRIPLLTARDVELRTSRMDKDGKWVILLAYKDARVDMRILDEVYGPYNWQRSHTIINGQLFCTVSIWDEAKQQWISKQDVGTESKTEAEKGRASDSFKRACFNLGIGRELYDVPTLYIKLGENDIKRDGNKITLKADFEVKSMKYNKELGEFEEFVVVDRKGNIRFSLNRKEIKSPPAEEEPAQITALKEVLGAEEIPMTNQYTRYENGKWFALSKKNGYWGELTRYSLERLNDLLNDKDYKPAHNAIFDLMQEIPMNNG